nr:4Fe-4S dicluster domain-containing protein [Deltaproteobacteria bacterium]
MSKKRPYLTKTDGEYEIKVRVKAGCLSTDQIEAIRDISKDYGSGEIHLTVRQEVLLFNIREEFVEQALKRLDAVNLKGGSAGFRVRNITCCVGARCKNCAWDPLALARELDEKFGEMELPGAVKIAVSGCPFPCNRPQLNDIGIIGRVKPSVDIDKCDGCGKCIEVCKMKAITLNEQNRAVINQKKCKLCGRCMLNCPISAISEDRQGVTIVLGGCGSWPAFSGEILANMIKVEDTVPLVGRILEYYKENALPEEKRLRPFVKRTGIEKLRKELLKGIEVLM